MNNVLVVFYSYTDTSRRLACALAAAMGWPLGEIRDARPRCGDDLRCIADSLFRRRPAITYRGPDPAGFDLVVLVSPIWALRLAGPMRTFVAMRGDDLAEVAVVSLMSKAGAANAVAEVARLVGRAPVADAAFCAVEVDDGAFVERLRAFGQAVARAASYGRRAVRRDAPEEAVGRTRPRAGGGPGPTIPARRLR